MTRGGAVSSVLDVDTPTPAAWLPAFVILDQYGETVRVFMYTANTSARWAGVRFVGVGDLGPVWAGLFPVVHAHRVAASISTGAGSTRVERWLPNGGRETVAEYVNGARTR